MSEMLKNLHNYSGIIIIILFIIIYFEYNNNYLYDTFIATKVVSDIDGRKYRVSGVYVNTKDASNTMAKINDFIFNFLKFLRNKFIFKKIGTYDEQEFVKRVLKNYNPDVIFENDPKAGEDTSYVVNKGDQFAICLRDKQTKKIHDYNLLQFVTIHELTHLGNLDFGHGYSFWAWMKFMLIQAKESGLYTPVNYKTNPITYCGLDVNFSPYYSEQYDWRNLSQQIAFNKINFQENY